MVAGRTTLHMTLVQAAQDGSSLEWSRFCERARPATARWPARRSSSERAQPSRCYQRIIRTPLLKGTRQVEPSEPFEGTVMEASVVVPRPVGMLDEDPPMPPPV